MVKQKEVMKEKKRKKRFETLPTELPGVQLRIEPGIKLDILQKTIENLYRLARDYTRLKWQLDNLTEEQNSSRDKIIEIAGDHEGVRGLSSERDNFVLTVSPRESISRNQEKFKKSLGITYATVVSEDLQLTISIPLGFVTKKGNTISEEMVTKTIEGALIELGISAGDLSKIMHQEVKMRVDEKKLAEMIERNQVKLLAGAQTSEITWNLRVDKLKEISEE